MRQTVTDIPEILFLQVPKTVHAKCDEGYFYVHNDRYEVIGVVDHDSPDINQGHYTAWVKLQFKWYSCDDKVVKPDSEDTHFSSNNYIFVAIRCHDEQHEDKERCVTCKKPFSSLLMHLRKASNCQVFYDMEAMKKEQAAKHSEKKKQQMRFKRANQSRQETARENKEAAKRMEELRKNQTPEKKARDNEKDAKKKR